MNTENKLIERYTAAAPDALRRQEIKDKISMVNAVVIRAIIRIVLSNIFIIQFDCKAEVRISSKTGKRLQTLFRRY